MDMTSARNNPDTLTAAGYEALVDRYNLSVVPHYRSSWVSGRMRQGMEMDGGREKHIYPNRYMPSKADSVFGQLEFAFKYDGVNPTILAVLFRVIPPKEVLDFVASQPTGKFARRLWYLYEMLTGRVLELPDAKGGSYVKLLDSKKYYTGKEVRSKRHYVYDNMLGNGYFCPIIRRTKKLEAFADRKLEIKIRKLVEQYDQNGSKRSSRFLYSRETNSSFQVQRETTDQERSDRFNALQQGAERLKSIDAEVLFELHQYLVDPRFAERQWRPSQTYVGDEAGFQRSAVQYIPPAPADLDLLMTGFFGCIRRMLQSDLNPVVAATAASFGFLAIRPFEDGNGRLSRFILHHLLTRMGFTPSGTILPISTTILADERAYLDQLEKMSAPLLQLALSESQERGDAPAKTALKVYHYRYIDFTEMAEYLCECVERSVTDDLEKELRFVYQYDHAKRAVRNIVELPEKKLDLLVSSIAQNKGVLSPYTRDMHFSMLTEDELGLMQGAVCQSFEI